MTEDIVTKAEFDELAGSVKKLASAIEIMVNERNQKQLEEAEEAKKKALSDSIAEQTKALDERIKALEESGTPKTGTKTETEDEGEPINRGLEYGKGGSIRVM